MHESTLIEQFHKGRNRNVPCVCGSGKKAKKCICDVSMTAKKTVKESVCSDINEAVMQDAEEFGKTYNEMKENE